MVPKLPSTGPEIPTTHLRESQGQNYFQNNTWISFFYCGPARARWGWGGACSGCPVQVTLQARAHSPRATDSGALRWRMRGKKAGRGGSGLQEREAPDPVPENCTCPGRRGVTPRSALGSRSGTRQRRPELKGHKQWLLVFTKSTLKTSSASLLLTSLCHFSFDIAESTRFGIQLCH